MYIWLQCCPSGVCEAQVRSSQKMMRVFGFASSLIEVLALGLQTYNRAHYRQLVKRIGRMMRLVHWRYKLICTAFIMNNKTVCVFPQNDSVLCQWSLGWVCEINRCWWIWTTLPIPGKTTARVRSFLPQSCFTRASKQKVRNQPRFLFWLKTMPALIICVPFSFHRLGIWLFMSEMPYGTLSSSMLWKVLYFMQCAETAELEALSSTCDAHSCIMGLQGTNSYTLIISLISSEILHGVFQTLLRPKRDICC